VKTYTKNLVPRARAMRRTMTQAERKFWFECLHQSPYKFRAQRPIGNFIVDFYCAELKLIIEIDGERHFNKAAEIYDSERTVFLNGLGFRVLRFSNDDVLYRIDAVKSELTKYLNMTPPSLRDTSPIL